MMSSTAFGSVVTPRGVARRSPPPPLSVARRSRGGLMHMRDGGPSFADYMASGAAPGGLPQEDYRGDYEAYLRELEQASQGAARMDPQRAQGFATGNRRVHPPSTAGGLAQGLWGEQPAEWGAYAGMEGLGVKSLPALAAAAKALLRPASAGLWSLLYSPEAGEPDIGEAVMSAYGDLPHEARQVAFEEMFKRQYGREPALRDIANQGSIIDPEHRSYRQEFTP